MKRSRTIANDRKRSRTALALVWFSSGAALSACPICFQTDDAATAYGVRAAVVVLGGVTTLVLGCFAAFANHLVRNEARCGTAEHRNPGTHA